MRIAMVCMGNICRSPMAEVIATQMVGDASLSDSVAVESFGTTGYHAGEAMDHRAATALERRGWKTHGHRARQLTARDVESADLVLCADRNNLSAVRRLASSADSTGRVVLMRSFDPEATPDDDEVPDPYGGGSEEFDRVLDIIVRSCRGLVDQLGSTDR